MMVGISYDPALVKVVLDNSVSLNNHFSYGFKVCHTQAPEVLAYPYWSIGCMKYTMEMCLFIEYFGAKIIFATKICYTYFDNRC